MSRSFRFGVNVGYADSRAEWAEKARKIKGLGYDVLTIPLWLWLGVILGPIALAWIALLPSGKKATS